MAKKRQLKDFPKQSTLFQGINDDDGIIDSSDWSGVLSAALDLTHPRCRYFVLYPDQWWGVLVDFARAAGHRDAEHASRLISPRYIKRVDEVIPQTTLKRGSLQLRSDQMLVARHGAYQLFCRSETDESRPIEERLYSLIDEALGVGGQSVMDAQARREQQRLGSTAAFAIERSKQRSLNREVNTMKGFNRVAYHNSRWESLTGQKPAYWRQFLPGDPLDYTEEVTQSAFNLIGRVVLEKQRICEERGRPIDPKLIPDMTEVFGQRIRRECLAELPDCTDFGIRYEKRRGRLLPVVGPVFPSIPLNDPDIA